MNFKKIFLLLCVSTTFDNIKAMNTSYSKPTHEDYKKLLEKRKKNNEDLNTAFKDGSKYPLLADLIQEQHNDLVAFILEKQPNINLNKRIGVFKLGYLYLAVHINNSRAIEMLLNKKVEVNIQDSDGETPLILASHLGHLECIKLLVSGGANVNKQNYGNPLCKCIEQATNPIPCTQYLLRNYAKPNITDRGLSPLVAAVENCRKREPSELKTLVKLLITFGADINVPALKFNAGTLIYTIACDLARKTEQNDLADYIELCAQQRDKLIKQVKENQPINYAKVLLSLSYVKDIEGNNLAYHALQNNNFNVLRKLLYLRPEMVTEPNFAGHTPIINMIDTILMDDNVNKRIKLIQLINSNE